MTSFKILEYDDDAYIELIEEYPCESKMQLNKREGEVMRNTPNCVNRCIAGRTDKEYREDTREKKKEYLRKYREENRDRINEKRRENRDRINEKRRENRDKLNEKFDCVCGGKYTHNNKSTHIKTRKHQLYVEKQQHLENTCNLIGSSTAKC
jgi:DNA anti-recombination protein RmuC